VAVPTAVALQQVGAVAAAATVVAGQEVGAAGAAEAVRRVAGGPSRAAVGAGARLALARLLHARAPPPALPLLSACGPKWTFPLPWIRIYPGASLPAGSDSC
jgi:hypothetical protein